jgi:uncharacterized membrane protein YraQ (UPF0718 family)
MMAFFTWLNDHLLKMVWLQEIIEGLFKDIFGLDPQSLIFKSATFFFYDVIKIFILLSVLIFISSYIQSFFSPDRTRRILSKYKGIGGNIIGALLGTVTPFCSCSSIPIFIAFTKAGLPVGVTFSFLISSPLVDLASVLLLASIFNWKIALAYVIVGLLIAVIGGTLISIFKMDKYVESFVYEQSEILQSAENEKMTTRQRFTYALEQVRDIIKKVWLYILIGVGIGAIIHGYIPASWIELVLGNQHPFSVPLATLIGIPMYADIFGTLPIAEALVSKGVGLGTVLAFMMAVTALSLPSLVMIKKVIKTKLLVIFIAVVVVGIIFMGYLFNALAFLLM